MDTNTSNLPSVARRALEDGGSDSCLVPVNQRLMAEFRTTFGSDKNDWRKKVENPVNQVLELTPDQIRVMIALLTDLIATETLSSDDLGFEAALAESEIERGELALRVTTLQRSERALQQEVQGLKDQLKLVHEDTSQQVQRSAALLQAAQTILNALPKKGVPPPF